MTTVNPINAAASAATAPKPKNSMSTLGVNDFITLMTTQLKYQDPTQPQDSTQFIAQLAQFSTVSGVQEMNASMSTLVDQLKSSQALNATSLVGHSVLVEANQMTVNTGTPMGGAVKTPTGAQSVNITVTDASGQVVRHLSVPAQKGTSYFTWDGKDDSGSATPTGTYKFAADAYVNGKNTAATTLLASKIDSVTIDSNDNSLQLNTDSLGAVTMADVKEVF